MYGSKYWIVGLSLASCLGVNTPLLADVEAITLKLETIEMKRSHDIRGDHLFFSISEFPSAEKPVHYQIPSFPTHWYSRHLEHIKNIELWKKDITICENVDLLITLVEQNILTLNEEELGSVELKVRCENGKFHTEWAIPHKQDTVKLPEQENAYGFFGRNSDYHVVFNINETLKKN
ncbi:MAG: hypothetical protein ACHQJ6_00200 [Candidatus Berkiellales bacterium]